MKQFLVFVGLLVICGGLYLCFGPSLDWSKFTDAFKSPPPEPAAAPVPPPVVKPAGVEYITPDSTNFVNSAHIHDVAQPVQPHSSSPSADSTPSPSAHKIFVPPDPLPAHAAWTWTTSDGKVYKNVLVEKVEADRVTIFHEQGSAIIPMYVLSQDIQSQLNFDPELAADALAARNKAGKDSGSSPTPAPAPAP